MKAEFHTLYEIWLIIKDIELNEKKIWAHGNFSCLEFMIYALKKKWCVIYIKFGSQLEEIRFCLNTYLSFPYVISEQLKYKGYSDVNFVKNFLLRSKQVI